MKVFTTIHDMQTEMIKLKKYGKTIGFVPTMGYLHDGHMSLLKKARQENDLVVLSIFVNPLQFGPTEDFSAYPRNLDRDKEIALNERVDYLFCPSSVEMYPRQPSVKVVVQERIDVMCGKSRPGHFDGVATVLTKLFHIVKPNRVYFGLKDAQQVAVVDWLIKDFHFPIELIPCETVREEDGLAKSSRNTNLLEQERGEARHLYKSLLSAKEMIDDGERDRETVIQFITNYLLNNTSGSIDYVEIYSYPELKEMTMLTGTFIIALAVKFSHARLIDNIIITI
ncbi:pantoate--beta-alanine ligase [Bacillus aquiflavi]|uniref:Pantothenate synthetase n=1 Tax=Bacillus aquiflavi TaxID=2672567 RepID=A0A6B3VY42_9BACI|nr:pantoate--beta-alanine ligase [Bacillus aquiflavi]MBA4536107.1 pantoate--beta-alanine ligase [Bacillus aquiflavi]NEY80481.1 pantoate--beta-alanine ligase [Bacillus aquiflavi]UAC47051.1 pantoate--beta-alanine ligase [Bacillus aquiflavi]